MRLSVINGASKTSLSILKSLLNKSPTQFSAINLIDYFHKYEKFENCFDFMNSLKTSDHISLTKLEDRYFVKKALGNSDVMLFFTHDYFENSVCKNALKKSVGEISQELPSLKKSIFINLNEYSKNNEEHYMNLALETDYHLAYGSKKNVLIWSDLVYGNDSSVGHYLKTKKFVRFDDEHKKFVHVDKVADVINQAIEGDLKSQLNYIENSDFLTVPSMINDLNLAEDADDVGISVKMMACMFSDAEEKHYRNLFKDDKSLDKLLKNYNRVETGKEYPKLNEKTI